MNDGKAVAQADNSRDRMFAFQGIQSRCPVDIGFGPTGAETVKSQKLRVEFSLEDMDTDGFKKGATYNAIRDWIKEKYGENDIIGLSRKTVG